MDILYNPEKKFNITNLNDKPIGGAIYIPKPSILVINQQCVLIYIKKKGKKKH